MRAGVASHLQMPEDEVTAFGMSMGFGDPAAEVNQVRMPREGVEDFARLLGFQSATATATAPSHPSLQALHARLA